MAEVICWWSCKRSPKHCKPTFGIGASLLISRLGLLIAGFCRDSTWMPLRTLLVGHIEHLWTEIHVVLVVSRCWLIGLPENMGSLGIYGRHGLTLPEFCGMFRQIYWPSNPQKQQRFQHFPVIFPSKNPTGPLPLARSGSWQVGKQRIFLRVFKHQNSPGRGSDTLWSSLDLLDFFCTKTRI